MNFLGNTVSIDISGNGVLLKDSMSGSPLPRLLCKAVQIRREMHSIICSGISTTLVASQLRIRLWFTCRLTPTSAEGISLLTPVGPCSNEGPTDTLEGKNIYLQFAV